MRVGWAVAVSLGAHALIVPVAMLLPRPDTSPASQVRPGVETRVAFGRGTRPRRVTRDAGRNAARARAADSR